MTFSQETEKQRAADLAALIAVANAIGLALALLSYFGYMKRKYAPGVHGVQLIALLALGASTLYFVVPSIWDGALRAWHANVDPEKTRSRRWGSSNFVAWGVVGNFVFTGFWVWTTGGGIHSVFSSYILAMLVIGQFFATKRSSRWLLLVLGVVVYLTSVLAMGAVPAVNEVSDFYVSDYDPANDAMSEAIIVITVLSSMLIGTIASGKKERSSSLQKKNGPQGGE